jgi:hypothetical protein
MLANSQAYFCAWFDNGFQIYVSKLEILILTKPQNSVALGWTLYELMYSYIYYVTYCAGLL